MTANFLLLLLFPHDPVIILLDNASWHWGGDVQERLRQNPRLRLLYWPTACPDLNPQEQVWKAARVNVSHNHLSPDLAGLTEAMEVYLSETPFNTSFLDHLTCLN